MTRNVYTEGSNRVNRRCDTCTVEGSNYASISASQWSKIEGANFGVTESPSNVIEGSNKGTAKGSFVKIEGSNYKTAEGNTTLIEGSNSGTVAANSATISSNAGEVTAKVAKVQNNVRGGRVIASEITYAGLLMDYYTITEMGMGIKHSITHEFVVGFINGVQKTDIVTLTRTEQNKWTVEAQGVTNELTVLSKDRLAKNYQLQLRYLFGELRATVISGGGVVSGGGNITVQNGDVTIRTGRRSRRGW